MVLKIIPLANIENERHYISLFLGSMISDQAMRQHANRPGITRTISRFYIRNVFYFAINQKGIY